MQDLTSSIEHLTTLAGFSRYDVEVLRQAEPTLLTWRDDLVRGFYDALYGHAPAAAVFERRAEVRDRREATLRTWYTSLVSGPYDTPFWREQWRIGLLHIRAGVENPLMLGALAHLQVAMHTRSQATFDSTSAPLVNRALTRLLAIVGGLIAEGYHQQYLDAISGAGLSRPLVHRLVEMELARTSRSAHP